MGNNSDRKEFYEIVRTFFEGTKCITPEQVVKLRNNLQYVSEMVQQTGGMLQQTADNMQKYMQIIKECSGTFSKKSGWMISPYWSIPLMLHLFNQGNSAEEIEALLLQCYGQEENDILPNLYNRIEKNAKGNLQQWHPLLVECVYCLKNDIYMPVIPALASIIEGVLAMQIGNPQYNSISKIINFCNDSAQDLESSEKCVEAIAWRSISSSIANIFESHAFSMPRKNTFNRHWGLHGRDDCKEWRRIDAIQLLNNVDVLSWALLKNKEE